jgi:hypothetical protein
LPTVFRTIDAAFKRRFSGARSEELVQAAPPGEITGVDQWVRSAPWHPAGSASACVLRGRIDATIAADAGGLFVVDFKTTEPKPDHIGFYQSQLASYSHALENPANGESQSVTGTGLVVFTPDAMEVVGDRAALTGALRWHSVPLDLGSFESFLGEVVAVLDAPAPPPPSPGCPWCALLPDPSAAI